MEEDLREGIGLHLGCWIKHWDGWLNIDKFSKHADMNIDAIVLPFPDGYADVICAIHLIEHFYKWEAEDALKEWFRVLKNDGKIIIELPCMDKVFNILIGCLLSCTEPKENMTWWALWGDPRRKEENMHHKWGYTASGMHKMLEKVGFRNVTFCDPKYHVKARDMRFEAVK